MKIVGFYMKDHKMVSNKTIQNLGMLYTKNAWMTEKVYEDKVWNIRKSCN